MMRVMRAPRATTLTVLFCRRWSHWVLDSAHQHERSLCDGAVLSSGRWREVRP